MIAIADEAPDHFGAREALLDLSFGPDRFLKTSHRLREGRVPVFAFAVLDETDRLIGTVRLWRVCGAGSGESLLLGPLAVDPSCRGLKVGGRLMRHALHQAAVCGHGSVILVGDLPYYQRFGFAAGLLDGVDMPGPVDRGRFLGLDLQAGHLSGLSGELAGAGPLDPVAVPQVHGMGSLPKAA
ncbi:GNAT family N-acetyltransferase [Roseibium sp. RKSG952]|uniref:GNAT family N-acetyltransferase n=1 Tax=Roseibium sp. RKSG952 TaxID=2529384 RepID=UPI0012BB954B|nr:N-acetyltransferase [Roseibium sp. RKSG952]MTH97992.1 N-acetyltransferase [Roseibium sp. RKSG952]